MLILKRYMESIYEHCNILPMASEFHWNSTTFGLIQSSFFGATFLCRSQEEFGRHSRWETCFSFRCHLVVCSYGSYSSYCKVRITFSTHSQCFHGYRVWQCQR